MGGVSYAYDGLGNRIRQTVSSVVTHYLNDLQPGLVKVLNSESNGDTTRYLHDISGLHSQQTPGGDWVFPIMDALGSLRGVVNPTGEVLEGQDYAPYGTAFGQTGTAQTVFGFTGEITDPNGLLNLRARYYVPGLGVFPSLDPVEEGNRYGYVGGNVVNRVDPSGMVGERPERWDGCLPQMGEGTCEQQCRPILWSIQGSAWVGLAWQLYVSCMDQCNGHYKWVCSGHGESLSCQEWLEEAYAILKQGGQVSRVTADMLHEVNQIQGFPIIFHDTSAGGITLGRLGILISPRSAYLDRSPDPQNVALLAHEMWHWTQNPQDRLSIWGEVESYSLESVVFRELAGYEDPSLRQFERFRKSDGVVTRDERELCEARKILLKRVGGYHWLYSHESLRGGDVWNTAQSRCEELGVVEP